MCFHEAEMTTLGEPLCQSIYAFWPVNMVKPPVVYWRKSPICGRLGRAAAVNIEGVGLLLLPFSDIRNLNETTLGALGRQWCDEDNFPTAQ